jgi:hypothetical protein
MHTSFQEFLRKKTEGSAWRERKERRAEWLGALDRLFAQFRIFLREADPEGLIEIVDYEVERVEERLGVYDAPALKIRLNTASADVIPTGLNVRRPLSLENLLGVPGNVSRWGDLAGGRVDVTDGERKHMLFRSVQDGQDHWYVMMAEKAGLAPFDRRSLEEILQDLLS